MNTWIAFIRRLVRKLENFFTVQTPKLRENDETEDLFIRVRGDFDEGRSEDSVNDSQTLGQLTPDEPDAPEPVADPVTPHIEEVQAPLVEIESVPVSSHQGF